MPRVTVLLIVAAMALLLSGGPAHAQTHLGQSVDAHVVLKNDRSPGTTCDSFSFKDQALFRVFPDGTQSAAPFVVPRGQVLVVTDVEWNVRESQTTLVPGTTLFLQIYLSTNIPDAHVFQSRGVSITNEQKNARPGTSEQLTAGFLVASGTPICPNAIHGGTSIAVTLTLDHLILRGDLIDRRAQ